HLRADEHVEAALAQLAQHALGRAATRGGVAVEARDAGLAQERLHLLLDALRAEAEQRRVARAAARAGLRRRPAVVAVAAAQALLARVVDERHVAVLAALGVAAGEAEDAAREAAAVQEQDRLAAAREVLGEGARERAREDELAAAREQAALLLEVDDLDGGERAALDARRQHEAAQRPAVGRVARLQRGRRRAEDQRAPRARGAARGEGARAG